MKGLSSEQREELLGALKARFGRHMNRHKGLAWANVQARLEGNPQRLWSLHEMERTGGEPDVVGHDKKKGEYFFVIVQPKARRAAEVFAMTAKPLEARKEHKPEDSVIDRALRWALCF